jgi:hypothetical protein
MNKVARKIKAIPVIISVFIRSITDNVQPSIIKITITGLLLESSLWVTEGRLK